MEGPGRPSSAALSVVALSVAQRVQPPETLTARQAQLWREIVATKPAEWFAADTTPLLTAYVKAIESHERLAAEFQTATLDAAGIGLAKDLCAMLTKTAKLIESLARSMRLTQQSRYTPQAAATADRKATKDQRKLHQR
jgi:hypothetical protein